MRFVDIVTMLLEIVEECTMRYATAITHTTYDCVNCLPWNFGPELCAAQVEGHSFFHIDEVINSKISRERASTAVLTVLFGTVSAKDIEHMFMNLLGANAWRWID
jgi:hypothetical protein